MSLRIFTQAILVGCFALAAQEAWAQGVPIAPRAPVVRTPRATQPPVPQSWRSPRPVKPFTDIQRTPTISPYLNLTRDDDFNGLPNYFALVRPQLQQEEINRRQQRSIYSLNNDVRMIESRFAIPPQGDPGIRPTGHAVYFMNYSHYFRR